MKLVKGTESDSTLTTSGLSVVKRSLTLAQKAISGGVMTVKYSGFLSQSRTVAKYAQKASKGALQEGSFRASKKQLQDLVTHCDTAREERRLSGAKITWSPKID